MRCCGGKRGGSAAGQRRFRTAQNPAAEEFHENFAQNQSPTLRLAQLHRGGDYTFEKRAGDLNHFFDLGDLSMAQTDGKALLSGVLGLPRDSSQDIGRLVIASLCFLGLSSRTKRLHQL